MHIDLHTHSSASDGKLTPAALVQQAAMAGVHTLAITDHDTVEAYSSLHKTGLLPLQLIPGIEFSTQWHAVDVHILGLNFQASSDAMQNGIAVQQRLRVERA